MLKVNQLAGFGTLPKTTIHNLYSFNGTGTTYLYRNTALSGEADGKAGTVAFWCRLNGGDNTEQFIYGQGSGSGTSSTWYRLGVTRTSGNKIKIIGRSSSVTTVLDISTSASYTSSSGLFHFVASWNLATTASHIYVNGVSDHVATTRTNTNIEYNVSNARLRVARSFSTPAKALNGCLGGFYLSRTYIDLSNAANLAKFYNTNNDTNVPSYSVSLGSDGSTPESATPIIYFNDGLPDGTNAGGGGNFTANSVFSAC